MVPRTDRVSLYNLKIEHQRQKRLFQILNKDKPDDLKLKADGFYGPLAYLSLIIENYI